MTTTPRTRIARLRTLALTGLATTAAATAALTLIPTTAQAAELPQTHTPTTATATGSDTRTTTQQTGHADNLDGWIKQSLQIMKAKGIPGSYDGLKRNIMRESGGNPAAQNNWDVNAQKGTPSKGLLQVIDPTF
ncbi:hypothetical protein, partial [Streptomyces alanosinicus]|uniref:hypothetical protein n=1 Tax=Streptomyces alanosinicus TaxID=68171 RepID=UPI0016785C23